MNNNLKSSYEVNYLHRIYSKLAWLVFSFTITTLIVILFVKHASFNFPFIAVDATMLICLVIAYTLHMFLLTRKSVHYNQYTTFVSSVEISPIKKSVAISILMIAMVIEYTQRHIMYFIAGSLSILKTA